MALPGRCTPDDVLDIIEFDEELDIDGHIDMANDLVTELCVNVRSSYSDHRLFLIERMLSAHFVKVFDPNLVREEVSVIRVVREGTTDLWLNVTKQGQQVLLLDTAGNFARLIKSIKDPGPGRKAIKWLGNPDT